MRVVSNISSTAPTLNPDGTLSAIVKEIQSVPAVGAVLRLWLPLPYHTGGGFGRYFLARCAEDSVAARQRDWSIYARRALFCAALPVAMPNSGPNPGPNLMQNGTGSLWELFLPADDDAGYAWLASRAANTRINLLGPLGQPYALAAHTRTLLVLCDSARLLLTLPAIQSMLDRAGRVTLLIRGHSESIAPLLPLIPLAVEVRNLAEGSWLANLGEAVRWADQLCAALPMADYAPLAHTLRTLRFKSDDAFAIVLVTSDLLCGTGACLACVVPTYDGSYTRACVHGPALPLTSLVR